MLFKIVVIFFWGGGAFFQHSALLRTTDFIYNPIPPFQYLLHHLCIAFYMYCGGLFGFVLSLRSNNYHLQFTYFGRSQPLSPFLLTFLLIYAAHTHLRPSFPSVRTYTSLSLSPSPHRPHHLHADVAFYLSHIEGAQILSLQPLAPFLLLPQLPLPPTMTQIQPILSGSQVHTMSTCLVPSFFQLR